MGIHQKLFPRLIIFILLIFLSSLYTFLLSPLLSHCHYASLVTNVLLPNPLSLYRHFHHSFHRRYPHIARGKYIQEYYIPRNLFKIPNAMIIYWVEYSSYPKHNSTTFLKILICGNQIPQRWVIAFYLQKHLEG